MPNYSAAVSGLVQNASALNIRDTPDPAPVADQPNGAPPPAPAVAASATQQAGTKRSAATAASPSTTAAATAASTQYRRQQQWQQQQQQGRQMPQKPQQAVPQQQPVPSSPASTAVPPDTTAAVPSHSHQPRRQQHWQQQQHQQQGFVQHAGPAVGSQHLWGDLHSTAASIPPQAGQLNLPNVDWSFQVPPGAAPGGPGAMGFSRTASSGKLVTQSPWPAGQIPPGAAAGTAGRHGPTFDGSTSGGGSGGGSDHQLQQQQQGQAVASNRASTSGFVVASSSPGRAGQSHNRGQAGSSVRPSASILSVQMNTSQPGQPRPSASHALPAGVAPERQAPYTGMGSAGQSMGVSLPSSIANNIWAVGDGKPDSLGTSAEQRPDMWASPSHSSPIRRADGYNGPGAARQPSLSHASEIRRVAEASGLCCPITKDLMSDPVVLISDGYTYERAAITKWLEQNETSPITEAALQHKDMVPNLTMRSAIQLLIPSANSQRLFPSQLERRHI